MNPIDYKTIDECCPDGEDFQNWVMKFHIKIHPKLVKQTPPENKVEEVIYKYGVLCGWCRYLVNFESKDYVIEKDEIDGCSYYYCDKRCKDSADCKGNYWDEDENEGEYHNQICRHCEENPIVPCQSLCRDCFLSLDIEEEEEEEDGVYRLCGWCDKEFHINDPHYYHEENGVCYCNEECFKYEKSEFEFLNSSEYKKIKK